jgi:membrane protein required for colicin V production
MPYIDILIIVVVAIFAGKGFYKGFFNEFLTFLGFIVAFFIATNVYTAAGIWLASFLKVSAGLGKFAAFLIVFLSIVFAFAALGSALSQGAKKLKVSGTDRTLGALFGAAKGMMAIGVVVTLMLKGSFSPGMASAAKGSFLAPLAVEFFDKAMNLIHFGL